MKKKLARISVTINGKKASFYGETKADAEKNASSWKKKQGMK